RWQQGGEAVNDGKEMSTFPFDRGKQSPQSAGRGEDVLSVTRPLDRGKEFGDRSMKVAGFVLGRGLCLGVTAGAAAAAGVEGGSTTHPFRRGTSNTNNTSAGDTASTNKRVRLNPTMHVMTEASMMCDVLSL
ncbi:unnamed protein product, partial [Pylaiella littoralis]